MVDGILVAVIHGHLLEHGALRLPVEKVGPGHALAGASGVGPERLDGNDAGGVRVGKRPEQHRVDHREDGDRGADAQREHGDRPQREAPAPGQAAKRVAHVGHECVQSRPQPDAARLFTHHRLVPHCAPRGVARLGRRVTPRDQIALDRSRWLATSSASSELYDRKRIHRASASQESHSRGPHSLDPSIGDGKVFVVGAGVNLHRQTMGD